MSELSRCKKLGFRSKREAKRYIKEHKRYGQFKSRRAYECHCGYWHMTSMKPMRQP